MKKNMQPVHCRVIAVDREATECQEIDNTFWVDEAMEGKLCAAARELVEKAAERMHAGAAGDGEVDVQCPDGYVVYRLSFADEPDRV